VRLFVLMAQYRKPIDFSEDAIESATNGWHTLKEGLLFGHQYGSQLGWKTPPIPNSHVPEPVEGFPIPNSQFPIPNSLIERFNEAVDDDLNFAGGLPVLFELAKNLQREANILIHEGKTETSPEELETQWQTLVTLAGVLGLEAQPEVEEDATDGISDAEIETMIQQRTDARKRKDFEMSDRIRNELATKGITLIDKPGGVTIWHRN
jgi:cysteinyl-tRNA synthetase